MNLKNIHPLDLMRLHLGMTITTFCANANIQYDTYYRHIRGVRQPSIKSIVKYVNLAKKYNYYLTTDILLDYYGSLKNNTCILNNDAL